MSNRSMIADALVSAIKQIDGTTSPYDADYEFKTDLHRNVYRGYKTIDEINDFPAIFVVAGLEQRRYNTKDLTESLVQITVRAYVYSDNPQEQLVNLIQDVEHVVYNVRFDVNLQVQDITIKKIDTDSGLLEPYGMAEIFLNLRFEVFNI
jgi:hypothetical protein